MSFRSTVLAATALMATAANAHMQMSKPVPYSLDKLGTDNGPVTAENFPCHSQYGFDVTTMNTVAVGSPMEVVLKGSAVHGGGSCQLVVTTDLAPTKDSKFKVIKSFEGNCPVAEKPLPYTLPASIPNGKATFAYTWFAKLSGAPEMYMNCAPIEVTGGASDTAAFDALPDMFVANIGSTTCKSPANADTKFPNPGADLVTEGTPLPPTGECGATGVSPAPGTPTSSTPVVAPTPSGTSPPPADSSDDNSCDDEGNPIPSAAPSVPASPPVASSPPIVAPPVASTAPVPTNAPVTPVTGGNTCTTNGAVVCNGTTQFGLCNNGSVVWQAVAPGTTCVNGAIQKRSTFKSPYNGRIVRTRSTVSYRI